MIVGHQILGLHQSQNLFPPSYSPYPLHSEDPFPPSYSPFPSHWLPLSSVSSGAHSSASQKYEETYRSDLEDLCELNHSMYTKEEIVKMEADVLKSLGSEMGNFTTRRFSEDSS